MLYNLLHYTKERQVFNLNKWIEQVFFQRQVAKRQRREKAPEPFATSRLRGFALKKEIGSLHLRANPKQGGNTHGSVGHFG